MPLSYVLFRGTVPPHCVLFGGTFPPCFILFSRTIPPRYVLFNRTVLPNSFSLNPIHIGGGADLPPQNENRGSNFWGIGWCHVTFWLFIYVYDGHFKPNIKSLGVLEKKWRLFKFFGPFVKIHKICKKWENRKVLQNFKCLKSIFEKGLWNLVS